MQLNCNQLAALVCSAWQGVHHQRQLGAARPSSWQLEQRSDDNRARLLTEDADNESHPQRKQRTGHTPYQGAQQKQKGGTVCFQRGHSDASPAQTDTRESKQKWWHQSVGATFPTLGKPVLAPASPALIIHQDWAAQCNRHCRRA